MPSKQVLDVVESVAGEGSSSGAPSSSAVAKVADAVPTPRKSQLSSTLGFLAVVTVSFSISSLGYSFINEFTRGELATVMRTSDKREEIAVMTAWRFFELALGWFANFDSIDLAALNLLSHSPTVSLREREFGLRAITVRNGGAAQPNMRLCSST